MLVFARELLLRGYPVDLVLAKREGALQPLIPFGARVVDCKSSRMLHTFPKLAAYLRANKPAAVYSTITHANIMAALTCQAVKFEAPLIVRQSNAPLSEHKSGVMHEVSRRLIPMTYPKASSVIAVSKGVQEELISMQPMLSERIQVLPTPVLTSDVRRQGEQTPAHPWFTERRAPVILSAGRLERHKGMFELLRAFAVVRKSRDAKLIIIGEGSARTELEAEVMKLGLANDVDLPGFQENPFPFMNHATLFVLNSYYEGLPNVIIQAMSFGTPIVCTDCKSGPSEILEAGRFGRLIPVRSHEKLVTALTESLDLPKHRAAQASAWSRYGAEEATSAYLACANLPERPR
ncbi:MAG: hypothetical protein RL326_648 [Pseudomonadota bacterium]